MAGDTVSKMAALVRSHPTMTVRELAAELGFAEEGSVYYWLRKEGHAGLRAFKQAVLADERTREGVGVSEEGTSESPSRYGATATTITTTEYAPWLLPGDELTVERQRPPADGDLVIVSLTGYPKAVRRYHAGPPPLLIHPARPRVATRLPEGIPPANEVEGTGILGTIIRLIREKP